jgi:hypothetical protein
MSSNSMEYSYLKYKSHSRGEQFGARTKRTARGSKRSKSGKNSSDLPVKGREIYRWNLIGFQGRGRLSSRSPAATKRSRLSKSFRVPHHGQQQSAVTEMANKIVSYRRSESAAVASRIRDRLAIFMNGGGRDDTLRDRARCIMCVSTGPAQI